MEPSCILGWVSFWQNTKIRLSCALVCFSQTQNLMLSPVLDFVDGPRILIDHLFWGLGPFFMIFKNWEEKGLFLQKFHLRLFTSAHLGEKPHPKTWRNLSERRKDIELFSKRILCGSSSTWPSSCGRPRRSCGWSSAWDLDLMKSTPVSSCKWERDMDLFMREEKWL